MSAYVETYDRLRRIGWRPELDVHGHRDASGVVIAPAAYRMMAVNTRGRRSALGEWMNDIESAAVSLGRALLRHSDRAVREAIEWRDD